MFGGRGGSPKLIAAIAAGLAGFWALSGFYVVQPSEEAVVTQFGRYVRNAGPGLRYHLPAPVEQVTKVAVTSLQRLDIGGTREAPVPQESLMLTRDENIVDLKFAVTYRVTDADQFVFTVSDPDASVKAAAESAMREVVGTTELQPILTNGKNQVQTRAAELMQRMLDSWGTGVSVVEVQVRSANPPEQVVAAFQDVNTAQQDRESAVNQANGYRNRVIAEARGDAARITQSGEAYREQSVRMATGDVSRFNAIYNEYRRAPGATRDRLYIETMERVLEKSKKVIIDGKGASAPIILPPDAFRPKAQTAAAAAEAAQKPPSRTGQ
jgi:membrane protease subunit HflK